MLRKLKPLHEVLAMYDNYSIDKEGNCTLSGTSILITMGMMKYFGKEIEIGKSDGDRSQSSSKYEDRWHFMDDWFEPLPVEEKWFEVYYRWKKHNPLRCELLFSSKESFLEEYEYNEEEFEWIELKEFKRGE